MNRFFLTLIPPVSIQEEIKQTQLYFAEKYNSKATLASPPHVTLIPPFEIEDSRVDSLYSTLTSYADYETTIDLNLTGFGCFDPKVIYVNVDLSPELRDLQARLYFTLSMGNYIEPSIFSFYPHLTVAFKDLTPENFILAWEEFKNKKVSYSFVADKISLQSYQDNTWNITKEFKF